jgi:hypothetical protein
VTSTDGRIDVEPDRHDEVQEAAPVSRLDEAGTQRADELQHQVGALRALEPVAQELRVEADLERFAGERYRQRLAGLAHIRRLRRDRQLALGEMQAQRRVLLGHEADAPDDLGELARRQRELVLIGIGQELAIVRELTIDEARREHVAADLEDDLVGAHRDRQGVGGGRLRDPRQLLQRPRRHVGLEAALQRLLEPRLLHAQA